MTSTHYAQFCALARATEIIGERWTLLIVRELLIGPKRFNDLHERLSGMSPTLLASRLAGLIDDRLVCKTQLDNGGQVYELTEIGRGLQPAVRELIRWGGHFLFPMRSDDAFEPEWILLALEAVARTTPTPPLRIGLTLTAKSKRGDFVIEGGAHGTRISLDQLDAEARIESQFDTLLMFLARKLGLDAAVRSGQVKVQGPRALVRQLPDLFDLDERR